MDKSFALFCCGRGKYPFGRGRVWSLRRSIEHGSRDAAAADVYRRLARLRGLFTVAICERVAVVRIVWTLVQYLFVRRCTIGHVYSWAPLRKRVISLIYFVVFRGRATASECSRPDEIFGRTYTPSSNIFVRFQLGVLFRYTTIIYFLEHGNHILGRVVDVFDCSKWVLQLFLRFSLCYIIFVDILVYSYYNCSFMLLYALPNIIYCS